MINRNAPRSESKQTLTKELGADSKSSSTDSGLLPPTVVLPSSGAVRDVLHSSWAGVLFLTKSTVPASPSTPSPAAELPDEKPHHQPKVLLRCISAGQFETRLLLRRNGEKSQLNRDGNHIRLIVTPEILVNSEAANDTSDTVPKRSRQRSHSSVGREQQLEEPPLIRATSDISIGSQGSAELKNSKSDFGGLLSSFGISSPQRLSNMLVSPSSANKANPLAMFAKGVQHLGANFDPRKMLDLRREQSSVKAKSEEDVAVSEVLCSNTRIIRL